ncbi:hypothetical protein B005_2512 [Nocardiopsis alba ATCC BAA-2165]|uniref:Uncharacterized protein n=1 Tax=Nocardiopsis alba (strain ATCC BAA-2165 / BE74) TaxID=1205910 RepID=J7KZ94_NOCAA|nr:hypothetical protein B005_2512 [Nocardiopsis alba ATCC BAA-2165]
MSRSLRGNDGPGRTLEKILIRENLDAPTAIRTPEKEQ